MSQSPDKVSVVIPCHNYARFLREAVDSVLAQTHPAFEIWVIDDGSTDETPQVAAEYGKRIHYLRVENRGAYGARNDSLKHLHGDFFLNVDADNKLEPEFIEKTLRLLKSAPENVGYIYTQRQYFGDRSGKSSFPDFDPVKLIIHGFADMGSLIKMELVKQYRFDERFNRGQGDRAFFLALLRDGIFGQCCQEPLLHYRIHNQSITRRVQRKYDQVAIQKLLIKTYPALYTDGLKEICMDNARNRILASLISNRDPDVPFRSRLRAFLIFLQHGIRHGECWNQFLYLLFPHRIP